MVRIKGTGLYVPGRPIDNRTLKELAGIEFDHERIESKLGIHRRHIAHLRGLDETTADFAEKAARAAIADAGLSGDQIDAFAVATDTPEFISPATSILLQGRIQGRQRACAVFDIGASCASFVTGFDTLAKWLAGTPQAQYVCLVGVYNMSAFFRPQDVFGYSIFADGAAAVILERAAEHDASQYLGGRQLSDGTQWNYVGVYTGGTRNPVTHGRLETGEYGLQLLQRLPADRNVKLWPSLADALLEDISLSRSQVDHYIFTQINRSVILEVMDILKVNHDKAIMVMDRYGYTGSACVPMALHTAAAEGRIQRGDTVLTVASGAGLAVAASCFIY
jgi:3-oxoacyl-[acyl-carrier-protein] synthase III